MLLKPGANFFSKHLVLNLNKESSLDLKVKLYTNILNKNKVIKGNIYDLVDGDIDKSLFLHHQIYYDLTTSITIIITSLIFLTNISFYLLLPFLGIIFIFLIQFSISKFFTKDLYKNYIEKTSSYIENVVENIEKNKKIDLEKSDSLIKESFKVKLKGSLFESLNSSNYIFSIFLITYFFINYDYGITIGNSVSSILYLERILSSLNLLVVIYFASKEAISRKLRMKTSSI